MTNESQPPMTLLDLGCLAFFALGLTLCLSEIPWIRQHSLADRLRPYTRHARLGISPGTVQLGHLSSLRQVIGPVLADLGSKGSRLLGIDTPIELRLVRAGSPQDAVSFRLQQVIAAVLGITAGSVLALWISPPTAISILLIVGLPILAAALLEQKLSSKILQRQRKLQAELPVIVEQLGMLLCAGYSLTSGLSRLADRGSGVAAEDLTAVMRRIRQGVSDTTALAEWAERADLDSIRGFVAVLALHGETGDLGSLISAEARSVRAEAHRELIESIERRAQLVWIPVTVATLVPGLIFLAVPFYSAMAQVAGTT